MNKRDLGIFLALQIIAFVLAGVVFSVISSRLLAGGIAGTYFLLSGFFMVWRISRWSDKWSSLTIYPLVAHVFLISLPMVLVRFYQYQSEFSEINIWSLPGPTFHRLSSIIFTMLVVATVIDFIRVRSK